jgi:AraC family transcriptional regulator of adaptative response / DNA-3-methyladenine glycosylase II
MPLSAVVTTGIYCRPGCPGKPKRENVIPFTSAAAAEAAGFRACMRCRPYRSATVRSWDGPELVCRAVHLVMDGALDGSSEAALAARLGVSPRHLRRLFNECVGATPDQVARSRRVHFARRLLDDTDLSVTDISFAAGYGSVRQFNRACHETFRAAPLELRARRRRTDRLTADGGLLLRLPVEAPLAWDALLDYFAARAIPGVESVSDATYRRTVVVDGDPGVLELLPGDHEHVLLRAHLPHWEGLIHVVDRARRIFGLDADTTRPIRDLGSDPVVGPLLRRRPGLRVPGTWDPFETGVRAIVGQQVSVTGASTLVGRIVARHGTPVAGLGTFALTHTFPTSEMLADADLDSIGLVPQRADAIRTFARAVAAGTVALDGSETLDELIASLTSLEGIGPWTAHYLALRMGERDAFPASDLGLRRSFGGGAPATTRVLEDAAHAWSPWRAFAATHLWFSQTVQRLETVA